MVLNVQNEKRLELANSLTCHFCHTELPELYRDAEYKELGLVC